MKTSRALPRVLIVLTIVLSFATAAEAKRKKKADDAPPPPEPASFEVHGKYVHEKKTYGFGDKVECDLQVYVVESGQPIVDAVVTLGAVDVPADTYMPGRYRVQQHCSEPGNDVALKVVRANQIWEQTVTMIDYPEISDPVEGAAPGVEQDLAVAWKKPSGSSSSIVKIQGVDGSWDSKETKLTIPKDKIPPYQHHTLTVMALGASVNPADAKAVVDGGEPVWRNLTPITLDHQEFDYGPGLVDQYWVGEGELYEWSDESRRWSKKLVEAWLTLYEGGGYDIQQCSIGTYEQGLANSTAVSWDDLDSGSYEIGEGGVLNLASDNDGTTWTVNYSEPTIKLQRKLPPTEDKDELKKRKGLGRITAWVLKVGVVDPTDF